MDQNWSASARQQLFDSLNAERIALWGSVPLEIVTKSPAGETIAATFQINWCARRDVSVTEDNAKSGAWQIWINAPVDWKTSQVFMDAIALIKIGDSRFKVTKREKPIGTLRVWKLRAEIQ